MGCTIRYGVQLEAEDGSERLGGYFHQGLNSRLELKSSKGRSCHGGSGWFSAMRKRDEQNSEGWVLCEGGDAGHWILTYAPPAKPFDEDRMAPRFFADEGLGQARATLGEKAFTGIWGLGASSRPPEEWTGSQTEVEE
jgi:hypothetical protein